MEDLNDIPPETAYMVSMVEQLDTTEALEILREVVVYHDGDVNFPESVMEQIYSLLEHHGLDDLVVDTHSDDFTKSGGATVVTEKGEFLAAWEFEARLEAALIAYHSPYPEVRAVTDPYDDSSIPVETFRAYFLMVIWLILGAGINEFFGHRQPSISLPMSVIQVFLYPCGTFLAAVLPDWGFTWKEQRYTINPGPYSLKEQMFMSICISCAVGGAYITSNLYALKLPMFYGVQWVDFGYQVLLILSTQFLGFGFAGIFRKICVYPVRSMWPTLLPTLAVNRALLKGERKEIINGWRITRFKFYFLVAGCLFLYFWLPDYLFLALSFFNWISWIAPNNFNLISICGSIYGLGVNPITTFDWNMVLNGPLVVPWYSNVNQYTGSVIGLFAIIGVYWSNYKWTAYMPINSNGLFTNTGEPYAVSKILTNGLFDNTKYQDYSPPYYTAANLVKYGAFFALYPFAILYTGFTEWKSFAASFRQIWLSIKDFRRSNFAGFHDPHSRMMSKYPEVPDWWFGVILVISLGLGIVCVKVYPAQTPVWGIFFAVGINFVFLISIVAVYSVTGFSFGLNVVVELIVGYALPGNGVALMTLKAYGYNIDGQAENYITDQKLAHYAKIPPKALFRGQLFLSFISCFVTLGVLNWSLSNIDNLCTPHQAQKFTCPGDRTFYAASVLWGVIGPKKVFGGLYPILQWCFLIGALLPIPCVLFKKYGPRSLTRYFQPTLIIGGVIIYAPYNLSYYTTGMYLGYFFMSYIKHRYTTWWKKYNYILSSALSAGIAFSSIIIFFAVQYHPKNVDWWGNTVSYGGIEGGDGQQSLYDPLLLPGGIFGLEPGHFP